MEHIQSKEVINDAFSKGGKRKGTFLSVEEESDNPKLPFPLLLILSHTQ